jgi:hypothetical protein
VATAAMALELELELDTDGAVRWFNLRYILKTEEWQAAAEAHSINPIKEPIHQKEGSKSGVDERAITR